MTRNLNRLAAIAIVSTSSAMEASGQQPTRKPPFTVEVRDVRTSNRAGSQKVDVALRFVNTSERPITLASEPHSGVMTDDRGSRYDAGMTYGLGLIMAPTLDASFTIAPGGYGDAFMEFSWAPVPGKLFGLEYALTATVRELEPVAGGRWRPATAHTLRFDKLVDGVSVPAAGANALTADACAGRLDCSAAEVVIAEITRVSSSVSGNTPLARIGVRFRNPGAAPLVLCVTSRSERGADDRGNQYVLINEQQGIRGIGLCDGRSVDVTFVVAPGASREATLEYAFHGMRGAIAGTKVDLAFAVRPLEVIAGGQAKLGREIPLLFRDLALAGGGSVAASDAAAPNDNCAGIATCYAAEPFTAQLTSIVATQDIHYRYLRLGVRFRNLTDDRLILCFTSGSGVANDEQQLRYRIREDIGIKGIGRCDGNRADPQFSLAPKAAREVNIEFFGGPYGPASAGTYSITFAVDQLRLHPGNQIENIGQHVVNFEGVTPSSGTAVAEKAQSGTAAPNDKCAGIANCFAAEPFTAQLTSVVATQDIHYRYLRLGVRFRNLTDDRLILCFTSASGVANDEQQLRYRIREDIGIKGIGLCVGNRADPQFSLAPKATREANIEFFGGPYGPASAGTYSITFAVNELRIHPGNQIENTGQHVVNFEGVAPSRGSAAAEKAGGLLDRVRKAVIKKP